MDKDQAQSIALALLRRGADDPERPWHLVEFPQGWLIDETGYLGDDFVGSVGRVIEKSSERILRFPTCVPTGRKYSVMLWGGWFRPVAGVVAVA